MMSIKIRMQHEYWRAYEGLSSEEGHEQVRQGHQ